MKTIAIVLLTAFVTISSFAEAPWITIGHSWQAMLSYRNVTTSPSGKTSVNVRIDYLIPVKSTIDYLVSRSEAAIELNCANGTAKVISDKHYARNGGAEITVDRNFFANSAAGNIWGDDTAIQLVIEKVCLQEHKKIKV